MPPARSRGKQPKKHRLTLAQLASYDDILTDALVDHAYYWTTIPKNRPSYLPSRGVKEDEISKIIQTHLIVHPDLQVAEEKLLATNGLGKFYRALKTDNEKEDFRRHLRRYMQIYLPDCPFEVSATNRYTIFQEEASITARRFIKSHETIKYLSGIQVVITPEEEAALSERKKDFSIVISARKKEANLFMGPARFANHDCDANARLVTTGQSGIEIIAAKPISVGDEITVTYSESYFGEDNCECLCKTCEDNLANGWAPPAGSAPVIRSVEDGSTTPVQGYSLRKRDIDSIRGHSETPSLTPVARPKVRKTRLRNTTRTETAEPTPAAESRPTPDSADGRVVVTGRKRGVDSLATPPVTPAKRQKTMTVVGDQLGKVPPLSLPSSSRGSSVSAETPVVSTTSNELEIHSPKPTPIARTIQVLQQETEKEKEKEKKRKKKRKRKQKEKQKETGPAETHEQTQAPTPESLPQSELELCSTTSIVVRTTPLDIQPETSEAATALPTPESTSDDEVQLVVITPEVAVDVDSSLPTPRKGSAIEVMGPEADAVNAEIPESCEIHENSEGPETPEKAEEEEEETPSEPVNYRVPGDYTLTPLLLSEPETAWVICTVCLKSFLQHDAYYTRVCCPRCERHSKLYGYMWPKTEPEGKWDKDERILDHRLVHRFLDAEDEAKIRGRKLLPARADGESKRGRRNSSNFGSGIWRKLKYMKDPNEKPKKPTKTAKASAAATVEKKTTTVPRAKATAKSKAAKALEEKEAQKAKALEAAKQRNERSQRATARAGGVEVEAL